MSHDNNKLSISYLQYLKYIIIKHKLSHCNCLILPKMTKWFGDQIFYNNKVDITPSIWIQKVVTCNIYNLPKTFFTFFMTSKKTYHIWTSIFSNYIKSFFLTISACLIRSNIPNNRGQELYNILFDLIWNTSTFDILHCFNKAFWECRAKIKDDWYLANNFKI